MVFIRAKRQFNSGIYERLALSRDKKGVKSLRNDHRDHAGPRDTGTSLILKLYILI